VNFSKMHGLGNDFIVVWSERGLPADAAELAIQACNRNFGIGGDGLVFIVPSEKADCMMRILNSDGSEAEQCGNAIRCVTKFIYDHGYIQKTELTIETIGAGVQVVQAFLKDGKVDRVRVDMGAPVLEGLKVPTTLDQSQVVSELITVRDREFLFTAVSMGNPHCVIEVEDAAGIDLSAWGPPIENHPLFPRKVNVEFITVRSRDQVEMRVWERGAGITLACGTGACATVVATHLAGKTNRSATVSLTGGDLLIEWDEQDNHVYMSGPAEEVFAGKWLHK
jgi:diaminopimelate epimerase